MTSWRAEVVYLMARHGECLDDVEHTTLSDEEFERKFDSRYGSEEGTPFTIWSKKRVYFPVSYDGSEWVGSVPRDPCDEITKHQGGG